MPWSTGSPSSAGSGRAALKDQPTRPRKPPRCRSRGCSGPICLGPPAHGRASTWCWPGGWRPRPMPIIRVHLIGTLAATAEWQSWHFELARAALADADPSCPPGRDGGAGPASGGRQPEAAGEAAGRERRRKTRSWLTPRGSRCATSCAAAGVADQLAELKLTPEERKAIVAVGGTGPNRTGSAAGLRSRPWPAMCRPTSWPRHCRPRSAISTCGASMPGRLHRRQAIRRPGIPDFALRSMYEGLAQRGLKPTERMKSVLTELLRRPLPARPAGSGPHCRCLTLHCRTVPGRSKTGPIEDGQNQIPMISSIGNRSGDRRALDRYPAEPRFRVAGQALVLDVRPQRAAGRAGPQARLRSPGARRRSRSGPQPAATERRGQARTSGTWAIAPASGAA